MPLRRTCSECGEPLAEDFPTGPCPKCSLQGALSLSCDNPVADIAEQLGDQIGPFKLVKKLGEGGYGVVYLAEQVEPLRRCVALKVVKLGMDTRQVITRFEAERHALARMDHPGIAKVFEAGATPTGRPYFVMELVEGPRITDYCREHDLSTAARLDLFIEVCLAVQHAHQKGIIHRDLKPSNILVAVQEGRPVPKVIDFGIAKATEEPLADGTVWTVHQQFLGTPAYMSPEQAGLGGADVDTRSDVYSLGVLLYELLTGCTPFEKKDLLQAGLEEMRRVIRETEPATPSIKLCQELAGISPSRPGSDLPLRVAKVREIIPKVRGDLDWIVMKCLEKDRTRRYESASGLARDIERHLKNEPVTAAAPGAVYLMGKFVRRHRGGIAMAASLVLLMLIGVVVSTWQALRATKAEREAQVAESASRTEAAKSRQVAKFLTEMLDGVGPAVALGRDTNLLHEILDKAADRVGKELKDQPEVEAELLNTIGNVYADLGNYHKAEDMIRQALALRTAVFGEENPLVAESLSDLGAVLLNEDKLAEAEPLFRKALALRQKLFGNAHRDVASSLDILGVVLFKEGKLADAEKTHNQALTLRRKLFGNEHLETAISMHNLGNVLLMEGKYSEAESLFRKVVTIRKNQLGADHPLIATTLGNLGSALWYENKFPEAETAYLETLDIQRKVLGDEHPDVATSLHNLACLLQSQGKFSEAEIECKKALETRRKLFTTNNSDFASTLSALASIYEAQGRFADAETAQRDALSIQRNRLAPDHPDIAISLNNLGNALRDEGQLAKAETETRNSLAMMQKLFGGTNRFVAYPLTTLANVLRDQNKLTEAEAVEREALAMWTNSIGSEAPEVAQSLNDLSVIMTAQGRLPDAELLVSNALAMRRKLLGKEHPDALDSLNGLASVLQQRGNLTESESLARECRDSYEKLLSDDWRAFETRSLLGGILLAEKRYAEAEPLLLSGYDGMKRREKRIPAYNRRCFIETAQHVVDLYEATSRPEKAADWKKRLQD